MTTCIVLQRSDHWGLFSLLIMYKLVEQLVLILDKNTQKIFLSFPMFLSRFDSHRIKIEFCSFMLFSNMLLSSIVGIRWEIPWLLIWNTEYQITELTHNNKIISSMFQFIATNITLQISHDFDVLQENVHVFQYFHFCSKYILGKVFYDFWFGK